MSSSRDGCRSATVHPRGYLLARRNVRGSERGDGCSKTSASTVGLFSAVDYESGFDVGADLDALRSGAVADQLFVVVIPDTTGFDVGADLDALRPGAVADQRLVVVPPVTT